MTKSVRHKFLICFIDFLLLNVALFSVQFIKRGSFELTSIYIKLFIIFYFAWIGVSLFMRKFQQVFGRTFFESLVLIIKSNIVIVYLVSFSIVLWAHLTVVSRMQAFGVCGAFCILELVGFPLFYILGGIKFAAKEKEQGSKKKEKTISASTNYLLVFIDTALLFIIFIAINYIKRDSFSLPPRYDQLILILYTLSVVSG